MTDPGARAPSPGELAIRRPTSTRPFPRLRPQPVLRPHERQRRESPERAERIPAGEARHAPGLDWLEAGPEDWRRATVLAEILGPPVSRRIPWRRGWVAGQDQPPGLAPG